MTGALKMGGFKVTGGAAAVAATDLPTLTQVESLIADAKAALYPVGSYYLNETDATNPGTLLGFGTWVAVTDKFIVARGSTYTATGGAATDSITIAEANLPSSITATVPTGDIDNGGARLGRGATAGGGGNGNAISITLSAVGSGSAISVDTVPPYQAAYIWKRTV
jgi:hypothetical protein